MSRILVVMSAADTWERTDGTSYPTGYWAEELAAPYETFTAAGHTVEFASPGGVLQSLDRHSADPGVAGPDCERWVRIAEVALRESGPPLRLSDVDPDRYAAIVLPGGHGPVVDLFSDADLGALLARADAAGTIVGAVCHGPAGLLSATGPDGGWLFAGRRMAAFTDEEESLFGTADGAPWLLASRLRERGARHESGPAYQAFTVADGNLITGQNPASSAPMADLIVAELATRA
ncbi:MULTISPECIES: type 1 glutamine amidotransferase domain-containing protein [Pseudonocardia]|uniref:Molecular chaperone Hsp31 and glyoxalase 3 n=2 Tax=Pseudonocardia TaxID=1847 RepID=A0A1Y2MJK4_PSEAH|nr:MULTISPECIES: type 1 glutamine amidotransferase domain-containing protein [Pseudonocardia]OSY35455.1 Molecular chaperone Hsp31 and glyoxalase 3 [Pseudonocardia autotrophica]TDN72206.1 putative intracellular protease/amidase [Pseudonocardia autotrophica]BBG02913.1 dimethylallyltransferase [Pseudonocardia autotrophica]GEC27623.1 dimethylallyltransferase [Pseudonocardia saturnea]